VKVKNLMQSSAKFCEVFALKFASFLCPKWFRTILRLCKYFYHFPPRQTFLMFCLFVSVKR